MAGIGVNGARSDMQPFGSPLGLVAPALLAALILAASPPAFGQAKGNGAPAQPVAVLGILAVVNDEPISAFDLSQRLNFIIRLSNLKDNAKTRRALAPRVLRSLIDETLKLQEIKNQNITVTEAEIQRVMRQWERQNRLPRGQLLPFLKSRGISPSTLTQQVRAAIGWPAVIRRRFIRNIVISEEEIDRALERYTASLQKPRHKAAEIFLPVERPEDESRVRDNANKLLEELRRGADFALLARQFSQSSSAIRGGDLGWVGPGLLPPEVESVLEKLPVGTISKPIRSATGYHLIFLRERRAADAVTGQDATVVLRQILLPVPDSAPPSAWESQANLAKTIKDTATGCADFDTISKELGSTLSGNLGRIKVRELPAQIRGLVATIPIGVASDPQRVEGGLRVIMVCARTGKASGPPTRAQIRRMLQVRQLEVRARHYLRDLRQEAFIDIRSPR
ncbi:MAG: peptidylprolyl isomerase [Alphaproteobacteria bacterium]|nr:peptidylprolyl isomerase [Alphaproteobacteria bacterium]